MKRNAKSSAPGRMLARLGFDLEWARWGDGVRDGLSVRWRDHENEIVRGSVVKVQGPVKQAEFFVANPTDAIQGEHAKGAFYEPEELAIIERYLRLGTFVDIGANIGNHTVFALTQLGASHAVSFEPNPVAARILRINLALNRLAPHVDVHEIGLGDENAAARVDLPSEHNLGGARLTVAQDGTGIEIRRGDDVLSGVDIGFLKIDVEGFEMAVLRGLRETIARCRPPIFIEVETASLVEFTAFCDEIGYKVVEEFQRYETVINKMIVAV